MSIKLKVVIRTQWFVQNAEENFHFKNDYLRWWRESLTRTRKYRKNTLFCRQYVDKVSYNVGLKNGFYDAFLKMNENFTFSV